MNATVSAQPEVAIIVAVTRNGVIGRRGDMPFHIPADLRRFKAITMGHPLVMGRRTFDSLPNGALPGRRNIVVSRSVDTLPGAEIARSLEAAFEMCASDPTTEIMVCGGGEIYRQTIEVASRIYLTVIDADVADGDTFFPEIDPEIWKAEGEEQVVVDQRSGLKLTFIDYVRR